MKSFFKKYHWLVFGIIPLILIYPSFQAGYIFALDWSIRPFITLSDIEWTRPLGWILFDLFSVIFSFEVFQRIFLWALFFLAGLAGFRLVRKTKNIYAQYFAGLFLVFNPFLYARAVEQTMIVGAGTVAFFWFAVFFLEAMEDGERKKLIYAAAAGGLAISFFAHSVFFIAAIFIALMLSRYFRNKDWKTALRWSLIFWSIIIVLNGNWMVASYLGENTWVSNVANFTAKDVEAFKTRAIGDNSVYLTVLALQGYWGEYQDRFVSIQDNPFWQLGFFLIMALSVFGVLKLWKKNIFAKPLLLVFAIAFVLAVGIASPFFKPSVLWLYQFVPFYIGLREPQKWAAVLTVIYAFFGGWGIKHLLEAEKLRTSRSGLAMICVLLPVLFSFSMILGLHQWTVPHQFPAEWHSARQFMQEHDDGKKILFLPWHSYMEFAFAGRNIVTPARGYFGSRIVSGNNVEFGGVYSDRSDDETLAIQKYILEKGNRADFSKCMASLGIGTVILAKAEDWQDYLWLDGTGGVEKILENDQLIVYRLSD
jgi:hypothetical protein